MTGTPDAGAARAHPAMSSEEEEGLAAGLRQFNEGYFFECHDTLEEVWSGIRGEGRDFFQGLIQVAVGFYHLGNGNSGGAITLLRRGLTRLETYGPTYGGVDLQSLRAEVLAWLSEVQGGRGFPERLDELPKIRAAERPAAR